MNSFGWSRIVDIALAMDLTWQVTLSIIHNENHYDKSKERFRVCKIADSKDTFWRYTASGHSQVFPSNGSQ